VFVVVLAVAIVGGVGMVAAVLRDGRGALVGGRCGRSDRSDRLRCRAARGSGEPEGTEVRTDGDHAGEEADRDGRGCGDRCSSLHVSSLVTNGRFDDLPAFGFE
jgi:hypothetical protein